MTKKYAINRAPFHPAVTTPYKIERNVPVPLGKAGSTKYPFSLMEINDSFLVTSPKERAIVRAAAWAYGKQHGTKYKTHADGGHTRVWRIA